MLNLGIWVFETLLRIWGPILGYTIAIYAVLRSLAVANRWRTRRKLGVALNATVVGFFHPFCNAGGGGERVLWRAMHAISNLSKDQGNTLHVIIYSGDVGIPPEDIISNALRQFQIPLDVGALPVSFVFVKGREVLNPNRYPVLTMLGQSLGSFVLAVEALVRATPDVFVDTTGFAFSFPAAWAMGCRVGAYVHYPTISTDMLCQVHERRPAYNNRDWISSRRVVSRAKIIYYHAFALLYGLAGTFASVVMVNSNWTRRHIETMWWFSSPVVVFPPCDTSELENIPINDKGRQRCILSVGQFRPEKDHALQVRALAALLSRPIVREHEGVGGEAGGKGGVARSSGLDVGVSKYKDGPFRDVRLVLLGSCRGEDDRQVLARALALAEELGVSDSVETVVNCSFAELKWWLGRASVGIHTMWNEHFGIGVVEMMAAGMVTIAHRSGGPEADIVVPLPNGKSTGFLAATPEEYACILEGVFSRSTKVGSGNVTVDSNVSRDCIGGSIDANTNVKNVWSTDAMQGDAGEIDTLALREAGRKAAQRFSNDVFDLGFYCCFSKLLPSPRIETTDKGCGDWGLGLMRHQKKKIK
ncbi:unnamed protein product [Choristocarpus tenellus]